MKNSDIFLKLYNKFDQYMRKEFDKGSRSGHRYLIDELSRSNNLFKFYRDDLKQFAELRNAIIHNTHITDKKDGIAIAEPHDEVIERYRNVLNKIYKPKTAIDICKKLYNRDAFIANKETKIITIIKEMYDKTYTCVPVIEKDHLVGVFSENVLISYIAKHETCKIIETSINDIIDLIDVRQHQGEFFVFCKPTETIYDIKQFFLDDKIDDKRLEMVFVTENGKKHEKVLGFITAWDLID
ncbi:CBS domain-containing protein [Haloplasma contractile]|uniref:CBS domain containing protein n=1 Tax=Haloplasma contractile SSD-17B TaxID=1033810 RepID=U2DUL5_9MOLU|nr:CBS domain-containing protein [Haloplasma contractile]ERJ12097.1 CBS domain containing protein [Haloplasma contractile SSD-17B]